MKTIAYTLIISSLMYSCGQAAQRPQPVAVQDTLKPMTAPLPLSDQELRHYHYASAHYFDSILSPRFNGSVLVAKNGEIVYERYSGFKRLEDRKDSVDSHTAFHLASVSKTFTAMAILKLWQDGALNINDEVSKYLPGFPIAGLNIQMLLSHRSGLRNYVHFMDQSGWDKHKYLSNADVLQYVNTHKTLIQAGPPGRHFEYSNTNYALLALIVEKVSGQKFPDYIAKTFFQPLQMQDTYVFSIADVARSTESYKSNGRPYRIEYLDAVYGDKNVYSTTRDLLKWDQALRSGKLLKQSTLDSAYMPYSFEKPGKRNYGLGWRMLLIGNGKKLIYHNGWWHGSRTAFIRMLDEGATIIALSNNDYTRVYSSKKLCDLFGDYKQSGENFEEGEMDTPGRGGEPDHAEAKTAVVYHPVHHTTRHKGAHRHSIKTPSAKKRRAVRHTA